MKNLSRNSVLLCLLFCIVVVLQFQIAVQQGGAGHRSVQEEPEYPGLQKYVRDTISLLKRSHKSSWEKVKSVIHNLLMKFSPNLEGAKEDQSDGKKAAEMSFHKSKETVKESAKSAAEMVGDAVHKTAEKVTTSKSAPASERESDSEL